MKKAKSILSLIIVISTVSILLTSCFNAKSYSSAKDECSQILNQHQVEMEEMAIIALNSEKNISGDFKKYSYYCNQKEGTVEFNIDAQGMLGGQYWSLVYTVNGSLYGETEKFFNKDEKRNDIVGAEKLQGNWWYLWRDYDGTDKSYQ